MKVFLKNLLLFFAILWSINLCFIGLFFYHYDSSDIPAPKLSNSYSFNEKISFLSQKKSKKVKVLALGSSMTLSNLHSKSIVQKWQSDSYLNIASWGMNIKDDYFLLKELYPLYQPEILLMSSNVIDFQEGDKSVQFSSISKYIQASNFQKTLTAIQHFNVSYFLNNLEEMDNYRLHKNNYKYLGYDQYGNIDFDTTGFEFNEQRWQCSFIDGTIKESNYAYLDSISNFCVQKNMKFHFFQSPFRAGIYRKFSPEKLSKLSQHINRSAAIIEKRKQTFVDANTKLWADSLYIDGTHFNTLGAEAYTRFCLERITN